MVLTSGEGKESNMKILIALICLTTLVMAQALPFTVAGGGGSATGTINPANNSMEMEFTIGGNSGKAGPCQPNILGTGGIWWKCKIKIEGTWYTVWIGAWPGGKLEGAWYTSGSPQNAFKMW